MSKSKRKRKSNNKRRKVDISHLAQLNINAAGIDIGAELHYVAVPQWARSRKVKMFAIFLLLLRIFTNWPIGSANVILTLSPWSRPGVYWIPVFEMLDAQGFDVRLVNPRNIKNAPGRKTDVLGLPMDSATPHLWTCCRVLFAQKIKYASFERIYVSARCLHILCFSSYTAYAKSSRTDEYQA